MLDVEFLNWTHELTHLGYDKDIIIPTELADDVRKLFETKVTPQKALNTIIGIAHYRGIALHTKPAATGSGE